MHRYCDVPVLVLQYAVCTALDSIYRPFFYQFIIILLSVQFFCARFCLFFFVFSSPRSNFALASFMLIHKKLVMD
jgi:hypothetical protein